MASLTQLYQMTDDEYTKGLMWKKILTYSLYKTMGGKKTDKVLESDIACTCDADVAHALDLAMRAVKYLNDELSVSVVMRRFHGCSRSLMFKELQGVLNTYVFKAIEKVMKKCGILAKVRQRDFEVQEVNSNGVKCANLYYDVMYTNGSATRYTPPRGVHFTEEGIDDIQNVLLAEMCVIMQDYMKVWEGHFPVKDILLDYMLFLLD